MKATDIMTGPQIVNLREASEMLSMTNTYVSNTIYDINNEDCVSMYDLNNRLNIYIEAIDNDEDVEEAISMIESMVKQYNFVVRMDNEILS